MALESENALSSSIGLDTTAYKKGVSDLKSQAKQIESSFRATAATMDDWSASTEGLTARTASLEEKLKLQKQALSTLNTAYQQTASEQGTDSKAAQSLAGQMYSMQNQVKKTSSELKEYTTQLKLQTSSFEQLRIKMKAVSEQATALGKSLSSFGKTLAVSVTAPIVAAGVAASKLSMDFEESASKVSTIADTTKVSMDTLKKGVLSLSDETGAAASDLNEALYQTISAGVDTANSIDFLGTATKLAKGGFTDAETAIDALTTTVNAYGLSASDATTIADQLITTQNLGKTTVADLGGEIGNVIPIASSLNVSTKDLFASLAELTKNGLGTAEAVTGVKGALTNILSPSAEAAIMAKQLGIDFSAAHLENVGWPAFLEEIKEKTGGSSEKMAALFGNVRALNAVMILAGKGSEDFTSILAQMQDTAGATDTAFAKVEDNGAAKWEKAINKMKNAGIELGEILGPILEKISGYITDIADKFDALTPKQQQIIVQMAAIAAAIGPVVLIVGKLISSVGIIAGVVGTFSGAIAVVTTGAEAATPAIAGLAATIQFMTGPIGITISAIAAAVIAFKLLWDHCESFRSFWIQLGTSIRASAETAWGGIKSIIESVWSYIGPTITSGLQTLKAFWNSAWPEIKQVFLDAWEVMKTAVGPALDVIYIAIQAVIGFIQGFWRSGWSLIKDTLKTVWDLMTSIVSTAWSVISNVIQLGLDTITGVFQIFKDLFTGNWSALWNDVKTLFSNIWNDIKGVFAGVIKNIETLFSNLASNAFNWGKDLVTGFIDGIKSMISAVADAAESVAAKVTSFLHFTAPDEGPLADYESWMPDFMSGLASGMTENISKIKAAAQSVAGTMSIAVPATVQSNTSGNDLSTTNAIISAINMAASKVSGSNTQSQGGSVSMSVDGTTFGRVAVPYIVKEFYRLGAVDSGGYIKATGV